MSSNDRQENYHLLRHPHQQQQQNHPLLNHDATSLNRYVDFPDSGDEYTAIKKSLNSKTYHHQQQQQHNHPSTYQSFAEICDPLSQDGPSDPHQLFIHVTSNQKVSRPWQAYIGDLDDFFERVYRYYQKSGFACIVWENILELVEIFVVIFLTFFFLNCIDYDVLFKKRIPSGHSVEVPLKITIYDCLLPLNQIHLNSIQVFFLVFAIAFWIIKLAIAIYSIITNWAIQAFYAEALQINNCTAYSWQEVQTRLVRAQSLCLLRESHLDELAIHNRLLRRSNYMIALVNKGVLPIYYRLPFIGEVIYLTSGLEFNLDILLFRGAFSLFETNWKLRDNVKSPGDRLECARRFSNRCLVIGILNLCLLPLILVWQSLYAFYTYVEAFKRDPTMFGFRTWSRYGRWFCRHFNELDHELDQRLNQAHRAATRYLNSFTAPLLEVFARFMTFVAGMLLSVLIVLTVYDEDVITVEHVLTLITGLGIVIALSRAFLPENEPNRWTLAELDAAVLQNIHYRPHNYPSHTVQAKNAMSNIFVYKSTTIIEELISPLVTPYILIRHLRPRALEIIDFFRIYTLELGDIGDVCTFSQFNFNQNGHRIFTNKNSKTLPNQLASAQSLKRSDSSSGSMGEARDLQSFSKNKPAEVLLDERHTTRNGKMELSLINFKLTNPCWQPKETSQADFIDRFTKKSRDDNQSALIPNLILPSMARSEMFGQELANSRSTVDFNATSTMQQGYQTSHLQASQYEVGGIFRNSFELNSSVNCLGRDSDYGFDHSRRRLLQLRFFQPGGLSEQEERDNEMALSSLYFHQMISDSQHQNQQPEQSTNDPRTTRSVNQLRSSNSSRNTESIPLIFSANNNRN